MIETPYSDRNGRKIHVGDKLKWVRDDAFFKSGSKAGQMKQKGAEFVAGTVVKLTKQQIAADITGGHEYWCQSAKKDKDDAVFELPPGLNFASMLEYIEIVN